MFKYLPAMGLFLSVFAYAALAQPQAQPPLPAALQEVIAKRYAPMKILTYSESCKAMPTGVEQIGIIVGTKAHTSLQAVIAVNDGGAWSITNVDKSVDYRYGATNDFLSEHEGSSLIPEIRCATPNRDPDVSFSANGLFVLKHSNIRHKQAKHLCFGASIAYNSWVCYWTPPKTTTAKVSFVQMNAD